MCVCESQGGTTGEIPKGQGKKKHFSLEKLFSLITADSKAEGLKHVLSCLNGTDGFHFHILPAPSSPDLITPILTFLPSLSMISWATRDHICTVLS